MYKKLIIIKHSMEMSDIELVVTKISWDDCSRDQNSSIGANITDITLIQNSKTNDIIRCPKFTDLVTLQPLDNAKVVVGNETKSPLKIISAFEYFNSLGLTVGPDETIINSIQGGNLKPGDFHIGAYNYQASMYSNTSVVFVVVTSQGTSVQFAKPGVNHLYFNNNQRAHQFTAETLTVDRTRRGVSTDGPMTQAEESRNCIEIWQIPVVLKEHTRSITRGIPQMKKKKSSANAPYIDKLLSMTYKSRCASDDDSDDECSYERAMISVGSYVGPFPKYTPNYIRDTSMHIRRTIHFYHIGQINDQMLQNVRSDITKYTKSNPMPIWDASDAPILPQIEQMRI